MDATTRTQTEAPTENAPIVIQLPPREDVIKGEVRARLVLRSAHVPPYIEISGTGHNSAIIHLTADDVKQILEAN